MKNLFNEILEQVPEKLTAGYQWAWKRADISSTYPTDTYSLKYVFTAMFASATHVFTTQKVNGVHIATVSSVDSAIAAGDYRWQAVIIRDSDSVEVVADEGFIEVAEKEGATSNHVYKVLLAIRATIEGIATEEQQSYSIAGRSLSRYTHTELVMLEKDYSRRWEKEKNAVLKASGRTASTTVKIRMRA